MRTPIYIRRGNKVDLPVLNAGEPGFAVDTKQLYIGHSSGNKQIPIVPPTLATWIAPTLLNSWVNKTSGGEAPSGYYKDDLNIVRVRGTIQTGVVTNGTIIFTLPVGYRPSATVKFSCTSYNGTSFIVTSIYVTATGNVTIETGANTFLSLDPIQFRAEQ